MEFFDYLYEKNAEKIKKNASTFGKTALVLSVISGVVGFFILMANVNFLTGLYALLGALISGALLLAVSRIFYGFGEIISLLEIANGNTFHIHKLLDENIKKDK